MAINDASPLKAPNEIAIANVLGPQDTSDGIGEIQVVWGPQLLGKASPQFFHALSKLSHY